ncbi:aspartate carbamoyltransferase catalytic subunit [Lactobacillus sp. DCY120]|uniref:Aspartate carbamoyltransferase n=1 Tax=Bombilactobacillus apium TaxID=2675299 RepID=A0A850RA73_9LACO|nr:aspartate carbamoyltransferase catalytic subunit [Bombilactobacillus apium]NVY95728.1 aspartate carbamoyltransferase catalytic subunit [Bombilactobacillus apium]
MEHDLVSVQQLTAQDITAYLRLAQAFKRGAQIQLLQPAFAMNLFFENSTRTHTSFEMAERRLGMQVLNFDPQASSLSKGESLLDTLKTIQAIGVNIAIIRHPQTNYYQPLLEANLKLSLANAGDGQGQHPSQSLLDMLTIYEEFQHFAGLKVGIVGDLAHSRVARSNAQLLQTLGAEVYFGGPKTWFPEDLQALGSYCELEQLIPQVDILMLLRVQHERLKAQSEEEFSSKQYYQHLGLTPERYQLLQSQAIIMHPAPVNRDVEIASELVEAPKSRIFTQMENGVYARMAILTHLLVSQGLVTPQQLEELS